MLDRVKLAFTYATDSVKQLLTLSTVILTFTLTFVEKFKAFGSDDLWLMKVAWILLFAAILFGAWAMLAITGTLGAATSDDVSVYGTNIRIPAALQVVAFVGALGFAAAFGIVGLDGGSSSSGTCTIIAPAAGTCTIDG